jgi:hypothetical protein
MAARPVSLTAAQNKPVHEMASRAPTFGSAERVDHAFPVHTLAPPSVSTATQYVGDPQDTAVAVAGGDSASERDHAPAA